MVAAPPLSKAEYLKRYLSGADAGQEGGLKSRRKRYKKGPKLGGTTGKGLRIVDDDVGWAAISTAKPEKEEKEDGDLPVVAEFVDERPDKVKQMEAFRSSAKWKLLEDHSGDGHFHHDEQDPSSPRRSRHDTPDPSSPRRARHDTPDPSPPRMARHDTPDPSPPRRARHDTPDPSPPRRARHDTPDPFPPRRFRRDSDTSPPRRVSGVSPPRGVHNHSPDTATHRRTFDPSDPQPLRRARHDSPDLELPRTKSSKAASSSKTVLQRGLGPFHLSLSKVSKCGQDSDDLSQQKWQLDPQGVCQKASDSDLCPPWQKQNPGHQDSDSDLSLPRKRQKRPSSDSDLSPPQRRQRTKTSDSDLSPPRRSPRPGRKTARMYSGVKTGLVPDVQREQQELQKQDRDTTALAAQFEFAETVFRDKSGLKTNLKLERLEQRRKAEDSERDELYAQWGKGLAQSRQQQQNVEDAMKEMQKPLARYIDDEDLDQMLREQEREGDPMANFIKKNKAEENKHKKARPRYNGPAPPPNRFSIWPGYRWDGVDRSNGFEQKRFARLASKKAVEELAYKWSVEDM
ncbi:BUD13 homolog [Chionomys nivalis]|uniref:BUD13 homolog n=1 Tax=Chionomys nivalis TaxID=269649 RepID=UPI002598DD97|nr:BUD13 homolog [Chionomys nivalis]